MNYADNRNAKPLTADILSKRPDSNFKVQRTNYKLQIEGKTEEKDGQNYVNFSESQLL